MAMNVAVSLTGGTFSKLSYGSGSPQYDLSGTGGACSNTLSAGWYLYAYIAEGFELTAADSVKLSYTDSWGTQYSNVVPTDGDGAPIADPAGVTVLRWTIQDEISDYDYDGTISGTLQAAAPPEPEPVPFTLYGSGSANDTLTVTVGDGEPSTGGATVNRSLSWLEGQDIVLSLATESGYTVTSGYVDGNDKDLGYKKTDFSTGLGTAAAGCTIAAADAALYDLSMGLTLHYERAAVPEPDNATVQSSNCTVTGIENGQPVPTGSVTITATAADGFAFDVVPTLSYYDEWGDFQEKQFEGEGATYTLEHDFSTDTHAANTVKVTAVAVAVPVVPYGMTRVYLPSTAAMQALSARRYQLQADGTVYDVGDFIESLRVLHFNVPSAGTVALQLGYQTYDDIEVGNTGEYFVDLECGTAAIPNLPRADYRMFLPFVGVVSVDARDVAGQDVTISYRANILTGDATVKCSNGAGDFYTGTCDVGYDIPFRMNRYTDPVTELEPNPEYMFGLTPYIVAVPALTGHGDGWFAGAVDVPSFSGTAAELDTLKNLLNEGVYL